MDEEGWWIREVGGFSFTYPHTSVLDEIIVIVLLYCINFVM